MIPDKSIKLLSLNISLFHPNNEKLIGFLKDLNPDIVCLQEATRKVDNDADASYISKDAVDRAIPQLSYSFFAPNWALRDFKQKNFHGKKIFSHDFGGLIEWGNYVKSRFKIYEGQSFFVQSHFSYLTDWQWVADHPGEEPRNVQIVDLEINNIKKLRIINYHGIWSKNKRGTERTLAATRKINQLASDVSYPSIICGDFNLFPNTDSIAILKSNFVSLVDEHQITHTRPKSNELSGEERNVVDYIFTSREINICSFKVIDNDVSDHFPLLLEFFL